MRDPGWGFGIDRFQRIRYIGSCADPLRYDENAQWFRPNLPMAANEAVFYNFEKTREDALTAERATRGILWDQVLITSAVTPGTLASFSYSGLFQGAPAPETTGVTSI